MNGHISYHLGQFLGVQSINQVDLDVKFKETKQFIYRTNVIQN